MVLSWKRLIETVDMETLDPYQELPDLSLLCLQKRLFEVKD